jgi:ubiquinone/menaquinone biosynthesis C-methylase UbiE
MKRSGSVLGVSEREFGRVTRVWGRRCLPLVYDQFLLLGELRGLRRLRGEVVGQAQGRVLELGAGTGLNMKYYSGVQRLVLSEPEPGMAKRLEQRLQHSAVSGEVVSAPAEQLPFDDGSFDTVVATMVFCTVSDPQAALHETRRVLASGGRLLFIEHVRGDAGSRIERWQDRFYRHWRAFAYGCRCNQSTLEMIGEAGLRTTEVATARWRGMPPLVRPIVYGEAETI